MSFEDGVKRLLNEIESFKDAPVWNKETINLATKDWFKYLGKKDEGK